MLIENKYKTIYFAIINKAKLEIRSKRTAYYETHHIVPKSISNDNSKTNLVLLTAKEHYICHKLLTKCTASSYKKKMFCALWAFNRKSKNQNRHIINSRDYEYARKNISNIFSEDRRGKHLAGHKLTEEHKAKISASSVGKSKSEQTRQRMKTSWENREPRSDAHCKAISDANIGRTNSLETRQKMSDAKKGINPVHTQVAWKCKHCGKEGIGISNYNRWHGDNCKRSNNG